MGSKAFVFLGLLLVVFLMISSEVAATRELAEASSAVKLDSEKEVEVDGYHGGYHKGGGYYKGGGYKGKGCRYRCKKYCCSYEEYVAMKATEAHN